VDGFSRNPTRPQNPFSMDRCGGGAANVGIPKSHFSWNGRMARNLKRLSPGFYNDNTITIAQNLLGKYLVRTAPGLEQVGRIVEVEAYIGEQDPACHAYHGLTPRTRVMYGPPGHAYVYFTYGMYFMLNVVTEREGFPAAVLIRAVEPVSGFPDTEPFPANGPGKLCRSMKIDKDLNGISLQQSAELYIAGNSKVRRKMDVRWSPRIGIREGTDRLWRAYIYGNPHVSRRPLAEDPRQPHPPMEVKSGK
jgi:DNA-3-methyladenine glycosylase